LKVLISIKDAVEAGEITGLKGVDLVDVKNPAEGTLGANHPWVIEEVKELFSPGIQIAASIGDLDFKPGSASLAAYGAASLGVDYITASMHSLKSKEEVRTMTQKLLKTLEEFDTSLIVAGYADSDRCGSINPIEFIPSAKGAEYVMLDTAIKDGKSILDFLTTAELTNFKERAHEMGLKLILAGSIRYPQLDLVKKVEPDVLGFRGVVCREEEVKRDLVEKLVRTIG
jgi:uncharacterized protein (UPF0264 family)